MADDVIVTSGSYSATIAADDIAGVHYQRAKVTWGPNGTANDADVATGKPLPIQLRSDVGAVLGLVSDAPSAGGETGLLGLAVRKDTLGAIVGTDGDYAPLQVDADGLLRIRLDTALNFTLDSVTAHLAAGDNNIGDIDVLTVPADPFGVNADAASATGSISAKLRFIAATGIPVTTLPALVAGTALVGDVGLQGRTSGGLTMATLLSAASTNATSVKASAGTLYALQVFNVNAAARYLKLYNKASAPTVGTDTPVKTLTIPGNTEGRGFVIAIPQGLAFGTGIAFALTTGVAVADTGAVAANELVVNLDYK